MMAEQVDAVVDVVEVRVQRPGHDPRRHVLLRPAQASVATQEQ